MSLKQFACELLNWFQAVNIGAYAHEKINIKLSVLSIFTFFSMNLS